MIAARRTVWIDVRLRYSIFGSTTCK
jgi:hypothetical protein